MLYYQAGSEEKHLTTEEIRKGLFSVLAELGPRKKVLVIPPDFTRFHSHAGLLTRMVCEFYGDAVTDILPALGTHVPMTEEEIHKMFGDLPLSLFRVHNWRTDVVTLGEVPASFIREVSGNKVDFSWPAQVNRLLTDPDFDLILSVGQVVPHEVIGMANYNKNIFVGTGGREGINKSHFLGAAFGMERIMGRSDNPVRRVLNYASEHFAAHLPVIYIHTVVSKSPGNSTGVNGLFIGDDSRCFEQAASLSLKVNFERLKDPLQKVVVYLDPAEFRSTWLGNKAIYRTRMAMADGGELIILGPGIGAFGEDPEIDRLIRRYGYRPSGEILELVKNNDDLGQNLSAAAHLIHGSPENRFSVTYCPGQLTREETEGVNFRYEDINAMMMKYDPLKLKDGFCRMDNEEIYYISNPALGLWAHESRLGQ